MPGSELRTDFWLNEYITPWDTYQHGITRVLDYRRTEFQEMYIVETGAYGRALVLDGKWQSSTGDEFLYHEPLVQPAMLFHGEPRTVLILGGGEGATAREALRWPSVERLVMVDIDGEVVDACRRHLVDMHQGAFEDPRLELVIGDALDFLGSTRERFDVVISDLSDPIEEGPSFKLFTREYFERIHRVMREGAFFVVQAGPVSPAEMAMHARLVNTLSTVFAFARSYASYVPTFGSPWGFALCSDRDFDRRPDPESIDRLIETRLTSPLRMLDGETLLGLLQVPLHLRRAIEDETGVYTLKEPPKFFGKGAMKRPPASSE